MLYIFFAGFAGFLVFDAYRIRKIYEETGVIALTGATLLGMSVHFAVYLAAGVLALCVNLDVVEQSTGWQVAPAMSGALVGPILRGFGLGLAGPAGLSRGKQAIAPRNQRGADFGELSANQSIGRRIRASLDLFLMR